MLPTQPSALEIMAVASVFGIVSMTSFLVKIVTELAGYLCETATTTREAQLPMRHARGGDARRRARVTAFEASIDEG